MLCYADAFKHLFCGCLILIFTSGCLIQIYKRLVDLLSVPAYDAQAAAVSALYNVAEVNMDCRLKLASERW